MGNGPKSGVLESVRLEAMESKNTIFEEMVLEKMVFEDTYSRAWDSKQ